MTVFFIFLWWLVGCALAVAAIKASDEPVIRWKDLFLVLAVGVAGPANILAWLLQADYGWLNKPVFTKRK